MNFDQEPDFNRKPQPHVALGFIKFPLEFEREDEARELKQWTAESGSTKVSYPPAQLFCCTSDCGRISECRFGQV